MTASVLLREATTAAEDCPDRAAPRLDPALAEASGGFFGLALQPWALSSQDRDDTALRIRPVGLGWPRRRDGGLISAYQCLPTL